MKGALRIGCLLLVVAGGAVGLKAAGVDVAAITPQQIRRAVLSFGVWSPLAYLLVCGQPLMPLPALVMWIAAGLAFGPWWGIALAVTGSTIRACGQFAIAKQLGREVVERWVRGRLARFDAHVGDHGFKAVLLVRLVPNVPFDLQNYGLGFSRVRFGDFALASLIGIIPWSAAMVAFGDSLTDLAQVWRLVLILLLITGGFALLRSLGRRT